MKRTQQKKQKAQAQVLAASQGSDDGVFTTDIVKKMESKWDKARKEKESKFLTILQRDVDDVLETRQRNFLEGIQKMFAWAFVHRASDSIKPSSAMYEDFQLEYASIEDDIRQTWVKIGEVVNSLEVSSEEQAALQQEVEEARAEEQLQAIALKRAAIDAFDRQIKVTKDKLKTI